MLTVLAAMALAQQEPAPHVCESIGDIALSVMQARQSNAQLSLVIPAVDKAMTESPEWARQMVRELVRDAYRRPAYYSPEAKAEEVMRFRNDWELACFERSSG